RKNAAIALLRGLRESGFSTPGLDDEFFLGARDEKIVPTDNGFPVFGDDGLHFFAEVALQLGVGCQIVRFLELLNFGIGVPLLAVYFVTADVKEMIGEELGQFGDELVEKFVGLVVGGIHGGIEDTP